MFKVILTGNVGKDPEQRSAQSGETWATFSVGVSVGNKQNPKTTWVDVSCNGKLADVALAYVRKGTKVLIEGFPGVNAYMSTKDDKPAASFRVSAHQIELLSSKQESGSDSNSEVFNLPSSAKSEGLRSDDVDAIPF